LIVSTRNRCSSSGWVRATGDQSEGGHDDGETLYGHAAEA
jgi:hypothetical protein